MLFDPARYVPEAASAVGLTIAPGDLGDVIGAFAVLARAAAVVMAVRLAGGGRRRGGLHPR